MASTEELENLNSWLDRYADGYLLSFNKGGFISAAEVKQLAETCEELDITDSRIYLIWASASSNPLEEEVQGIVPIPRFSSRVRLEPTPLTFDDYIERTPGRLELFNGYLGGDIQDSFNLLDISLETFGLLQVVQRAPKELWEEALNQVYCGG